ncbi:ROK family protein [Spiroplasma taiwanense]|uniref:ROK family protein n=1 Tax=Spiroplasma taiwanense TaxID=2145 RepID=UPI00040DB82A|nr:ROK family protein [Spiroplasma taiwanense]
MLNSSIDNEQYLNMSSFCGMNALENNYFQKINNKKTGKKIYDLYEIDNEAKKAIDEQIFNLAKLIINTSFVIDPQIFIIGGAVSKNSLFINLLNEKITKLYKMSAIEQKFNVVVCKFYNDSNIIGASVLDM